MRWHFPLTGLLFAAAAVAATQPEAPSPAAKLEVRLVVPCQTGETALVLVGANEEFCLAKEAMFDASGVVKVERYPTLPKAVMHITAAASERLYDQTAEKSGERVGFVFNGRLIFVPYVFDAVKTTDLTITLKNDPEDIDALVAAFPGTVAEK